MIQNTVPIRSGSHTNDALTMDATKKMKISDSDMIHHIFPQGRRGPVVGSLTPPPESGEFLSRLIVYLNFANEEVITSP